MLILIIIFIILLNYFTLLLYYLHLLWFFLLSGNKWYVDTMVSVILVAGDFVAEPVWHRVVMIVTNNIGKKLTCSSVLHDCCIIWYQFITIQYSWHRYSDGRKDEMCRTQQRIRLIRIKHRRIAIISVKYRRIKRVGEVERDVIRKEVSPSHSWSPSWKWRKLSKISIIWSCNYNVNWYITECQDFCHFVISLNEGSFLPISLPFLLSSSLYLSTYLSTNLSIYLYIYLSIYLPIYLPTYLCLPYF